jgi:hypothetical protein
VVSAHTKVLLTRMRVNRTLTSVITTRSSVVSTCSVILICTNVITTQKSVISTRIRLISTRRVRYSQAECDFTRRVWFLHAECNFHTQCDFDMHECDNDTNDCGFSTHKNDFYTQSVIMTLISVIAPHTTVTYTRTSWISNEASDFNTKLKLTWDYQKILDLVLTSG